jgi:SAM-dependent methyltransferase
VFDERFGVDTAGVVRLESLTVHGPHRDLAHKYQATEPEVFRRMVTSLPIRCEDFVFVDIGSGKGRVLLMASDLPFKRIVGVEFSEALHKIARRNIESYSSPSQRCAAVETICMDAAEYDPPDDPLVLYFYNPFLEPVMYAVMTRVAASLRRTPRPAYVLVTGAPVLGRVIAGAGFVALDTDGPSVPGNIFVSSRAQPAGSATGQA